MADSKALTRVKNTKKKEGIFLTIKQLKAVASSLENYNSKPDGIWFLIGESNKLSKQTVELIPANLIIENNGATTINICTTKGKFGYLKVPNCIDNDAELHFALEDDPIEISTSTPIVAKMIQPGDLFGGDGEPIVVNPGGSTTEPGPGTGSAIRTPPSATS